MRLPTPQDALRWHLAAIALLCLPALVDAVVQIVAPHAGWLPGMRTALHLDQEMNAPSAFSAFGWLLLAAASAWLARLAAPWRARLVWLGAVVAALFLGADELLQFHENLADAAGVIHATGFVWQVWVAVYGAAALVALAVAAPVIWAMAVRERAFFAIGAAMFLLGALGFEAIGGSLVADLPFSVIRENPPWTYRLSVVCEESLEMIGLALALRGVFGEAVRVSAARRARSTGPRP